MKDRGDEIVPDENVTESDEATGGHWWDDGPDSRRWNYGPYLDIDHERYYWDWSSNIYYFWCPSKHRYIEDPDFLCDDLCDDGCWPHIPYENRGK